MTTDLLLCFALGSLFGTALSGLAALHLHHRHLQVVADEHVLSAAARAHEAYARGFAAAKEQNA